MMERYKRISEEELYKVQPIKNPDDQKKIALALKSNKYGDRDYLLFKIGISTGLRISDLLNTTVGQWKDWLDNGGNGTIIPSKTDKRHLNERGQLVGDCKRVYFQIRGRLYDEIQDFITGKDDNRYMFETQKKSKMTRQTAWLYIKQGIEKAGVEGNFGTHTLRKTFGYNYYKRTEDISRLQMIFNHSSPEITKRYIGLDEETIRSYLDDSPDLGW